jgi:thiamine-phosphate pyrophosphorylase
MSIKHTPAFSPIYAITDPALLPKQKLFEGVEAALEGGVRLFQLRNKSASAHEKLKQAKQLVKICNAYQAQLIINDDIEVARLSSAHGVHLGQDDAHIQFARNTLGKYAIIGITCHADLELARDAIYQGADYVAFGRFFASHTKPNASTAPLNIIRSAKSEFSTPVVAIGGITSDNMPQVINNGADSIAVCHSLFAAENIQKQAQVMIQRFRSAINS